MIISRSKAFIYVHIYKTGGTSLTRLLAPYVDEEFRSPEPKMEGPGWQETWHFKGAQHSQLAPNLAALAYRGIDLRRMFLFTVVRNPYDWALSVWNNFYRYDGKSPAVRLFGGKYPNRSFTDFLRFMIECRDGLDRTMWGCYPQVDFFQNPVKPPDFIGRMESFEADIRKIAERLGIKVDEIPHDLRNRPEERADPMSFYTAEALELANQLYKRDFDRLGYHIQKEAR